jgi:hypothetical protein
VAVEAEHIIRKLPAVEVLVEEEEEAMAERLEMELQIPAAAAEAPIGEASQPEDMEVQVL